MKTDDLVTLLAKDKPQTKPQVSLVLLSAALIPIFWLITWCWLGVRPELEAMIFPLSLFFKTAILACLIIFSIQALDISSVPTGRAVKRHLMTGFVVIFALSLAYEWATKPVADIAALFLLPNFNFCLTHVTMYGLIISMPLLWLMRNAAPLDYTKTAGYIGLTAGCIAGLGYSIHCPIDSPTFILVAYGLPQIALYGLARLTLPKFLHW